VSGVGSNDYTTSLRGLIPRFSLLHAYLMIRVVGPFEYNENGQLNCRNHLISLHSIKTYYATASLLNTTSERQKP